MKKVKQMFLMYPEIKELSFTDSGETIICKTNNGGTYLVTTFKELERELNAK